MFSTSYWPWLLQVDPKQNSSALVGFLHSSCQTSLEHELEKWSIASQFQHLLFSSFCSCENPHSLHLLQPWSVRKNRHFGISCSFSFSPPPVFSFTISLLASNLFILNFLAFSPSGFFFLPSSWCATCSNSGTPSANEVTDDEVGVASTCNINLAKLTVKLRSLLFSKGRSMMRLRPFSNKKWSGSITPNSLDPPPLM